MSAVPQQWVAGWGASAVREPAAARADAEAQRDDWLMQQLGRGAPHALDELVRRYHQRVFAFAARLLGSVEAAEDVTQETFLRVLERAPRYAPKGKFAVWLLTIAANLCKDYRKQQRRRAETSLDALEGTEADVVDVEEEAARRLLFRRVCEAGAQLSHEHWTAVVLKHYEGFGYDDIARVMGCSVGTAKSRVHYGLKRLRELLGAEDEMQ
ncbi:MAG: RNA polymerase sigma factor [Abditibacteriales bacterium]|nr:RNA polymerase sigma factor [Abditibacteriales bacterium]MDW8367877.1 RNA polymerase sigma factor [Abditibacteriales bacterium]